MSSVDAVFACRRVIHGGLHPRGRSRSTAFRSGRCWWRRCTDEFHGGRFFNSDKPLSARRGVMSRTDAESGGGFVMTARGSWIHVRYCT